MKTIKIDLPLTEKQILQLRSGDFLELSGSVYTMRDAAHARIHQLLEAKKELPFDLKNAACSVITLTYCSVLS